MYLISFPTTAEGANEKTMMFSQLISPITADLRQAGFIKDADELQHIANLALDETLLACIRTDALKQIEMRCHVKWLGDLYLPHLSQKDWWGQIQKLGRATKKRMQPDS